jgi:hypothetical protein
MNHAQHFNVPRETAVRGVNRFGRTTSAFLFTPSLASAHAIAGDRVFSATMAVDDPDVGDEANLVYGHIRVPGDDGDQSINTFDFEYDKLITPRLAVSVGGTYAMQNNPTARGFDNFSVGLKYLLYVNEAHEFMTSVGVSAELGSTGSRAIADNFSTISPTTFAGNLRRAHRATSSTLSSRERLTKKVFAKE